MAGLKKHIFFQFKAIVASSTETYLNSGIAVNSDTFYDLGLTDSLLLNHAAQCEVLITSDSMLSDYATGNAIPVFDLVKRKNERL